MDKAIKWLELSCLSLIYVDSHSRRGLSHTNKRRTLLESDTYPDSGDSWEQVHGSNTRQISRHNSVMAATKDRGGGHCQAKRLRERRDKIRNFN